MTQQTEKRYANEYLLNELPEKHWQTRVWLGPLPPGKEAREYMVTGRWADAIVFDYNTIQIIEFKLEPSPKAVGQLDLYANLFKQTLRFQKYWDFPVFKVFVTTRVDEHLRELCQEHGIEYRVYRPKWIKFYEQKRFRL